MEVGQNESCGVSRAVARSENPGGHVVLGTDNVPPLVEIGLSDLPKTEEARIKKLKLKNGFEVLGYVFFGGPVSIFSLVLHLAMLIVGVQYNSEEQCKLEVNKYI